MLRLFIVQVLPATSIAELGSRHRKPAWLLDNLGKVPGQYLTQPQNANALVELIPTRLQLFKQVLLAQMQDVLSMNI
jgi:hypothetical protein